MRQNFQKDVELQMIMAYCFWYRFEYFRLIAWLSTKESCRRWSPWVRHNLAVHSLTFVVPVAITVLFHACFSGSRKRILRLLLNKVYWTPQLTDVVCPWIPEYDVADNGLTCVCYLHLGSDHCLVSQLNRAVGLSTREKWRSLSCMTCT